MRFFFVLLLLPFLNCAESSSILDISFENDKIYLFLKKTDTKYNKIISNYNVNNTNFSHVGIGFIEKNSIVIYEVINKEKGKNCLSKTNINSFYNIDEMIYSGTILCIKNTTQDHILKIKEIIKDYSFINYDSTFEIKNDNYFYCSEFVVDVLNRAKVMRFKKYKKELIDFHAHVLKRDTLEYYPVDMFYKNENIEIIKFW